MMFERLSPCQHIRKLPLFLRLVVSVLGGTLIASLLFALVLWGVEGSLLHFFFSVMMLFLVALMLAVPFLAITVMAALVFHRSIQNHLLLWCLAAPVLVWCMAAVFWAVRKEGAQPLIARLLNALTGGDSLVFLLFSIPCAVLFYLIGRPRENLK